LYSKPTYSATMPASTINTIEWSHLAAGAECNNRLNTMKAKENI